MQCAGAVFADEPRRMRSRCCRRDGSPTPRHTPRALRLIFATIFFTPACLRYFIRRAVPRQLPPPTLPPGFDIPSPEALAARERAATRKCAIFLLPRFSSLRLTRVTRSNMMFSIARFSARARPPRSAAHTFLRWSVKSAVLRFSCRFRYCPARAFRQRPPDAAMP